MENQKEEILDNSHKLLNSKEYQTIAGIFDVHKGCDRVLAIVGSKKVNYALSNYEHVIRESVAKSGLQIVNITRKEFVEFVPCVKMEKALLEKELEDKDNAANNYETATEVIADAKEEVSENYEDNPFAQDLPLTDTVEEVPGIKSKKR